MSWQETNNYISDDESEENIFDGKIWLQSSVLCNHKQILNFSAEQSIFRPIKIANRMLTLRDITELIHDTEFTDELIAINGNNFHDVTTMKTLICKFISRLYKTHIPIGAKIHVSDHNQLSSIHPSSILGAIDSIELPQIEHSSCNTTPSNSEADITEVQRTKKVNRYPKHVSILKHLTVDDYVDSFRKEPPYLVSQTRRFAELLEPNKKQKCDVWPSVDSTKRVRVCHLSEDISISRHKKPTSGRVNVMEKPTSSILRINYCQPSNSEEMVSNADAHHPDTCSRILGAVDSIEIMVKKTLGKCIEK